MSFPESPTSVFVSRPNIITGKQEWEFLSEDYDYEQEIARSSYGDMLHDHDRNRKYYMALKKVIADMKANGKRVHVLDIGTGTGLLSMMAVKCGADKVTACEAFPPIANCATKVIQRNQMSNKITVIPKRSIDVVIGVDGAGDMSERANVLVAEVFDTELIGEGALSTFHHAATHLLTSDAVVIPSAAKMFVQLADSTFLWQHNRLVVPNMPTRKFNVPVECEECVGCPSVYDLQISQLESEDSILLSDPIMVKRFCFGPPASQIQFVGQAEHNLTPIRSGSGNAFFMWWDLEMEPSGEIHLTCAPKWASSLIEQNSNYDWRDHWMQAVYFPRKPLNVCKDKTVKFIFKHDEYSLWLDFVVNNEALVTQSNFLNDSVRSVRPVCSCGLHIAWGRSRIAYLNSSECWQHYQQIAHHLRLLNFSSHALVIVNDASLLPLHLSLSDFTNLHHLDQNPLSRKFIKSLHESNAEFSGAIKQYSGMVELTAAFSEYHEGIKAVISEPYFITSLLPWHNIHFWYALEEIRPFLDDDAVISPRTCVIKAILVEFQDLWKIRAPVGICEEFDISPFDDMINKSSGKTDSLIEPQPLWEYPARALSDAQTVASFDFLQSIHEVEDQFSTTVELSVECAGSLNGIAVWCDWEILPNLWHSTGLITEPELGKSLQWHRYHQQGVHLLSKPHTVSQGSLLSVQCDFKKCTGNIDISFPSL